jgi:hypothetical protein
MNKKIKATTNLFFADIIFYKIGKLVDLTDKACSQS